MLKSCLFLFFFFLPLTLRALEFPFPEKGIRLLGERKVHLVQKGEHLELIAKKYNVPFLSLLSINPEVDPYLPDVDTFLTIPHQVILPQVSYVGILINLAELRLYYFDTEYQKIHIFPIGIGRIERDTPIMISKITEKRENPIWYPTPSIRKEYEEEKGIILPKRVKPGPENPLGTHSLRLDHGKGEYLIHGTNKDFGVGLRVSAGCIRMRPEDIAWLYSQVQLNEKVQVINQPVKISVEPDGAVYVEVHRPLSRDQDETFKRIMTLPDPKVSDFLSENGMKVSRYRAALAVQSGLPTEIGKAKFINKNKE